MQSYTDIDRIREALGYISPDDRDTWLRVGMAVKSELGDGGYDIWDAWSQGSKAYKAAGAKAVWRSFNGSGVTIGTLYHLAQQGGLLPNGAGILIHSAPSAAETKPEQAERHAEAVKEVVRLLSAAMEDPATHPYAIKKRIPLGHHVKRGEWPQRGWHDALLVPMYDTSGLITSIEAINSDGTKDSLSGGRKSGSFHPFGKITSASRIFISEGVASTAVAALLSPAACCFGKSNFPHVAQAVRELAPQAEIIIVADNDLEPPKKAYEAAQAVGGRVVMPGGSAKCDLWDVWDKGGLEAVTAVVVQPALVGSEWPEAQPLTVTTKSETYPLDALPATILGAVNEVAAFVKAPIPLVASSALSAASLAISGLVDVTRADKLCGPTSLFLLTIADSGERKSTCDGFFTAAIRQYQEEQAQLLKPDVERHKAEMSAWLAEREGVLLNIKSKSRKGTVPEELRTALADLQHYEPVPPRVPRLLYTDATPEALSYGLARNWPVAGVTSSEAGAILGSHGMGKDSVLRNLALLNILWDGGTVAIDRRTSESFTARGRLTLALQIQEPALRSFFERTGDLARGTGFLARFLISWPESTQGTRYFAAAPKDWPALSAFNARVAGFLAQPLPVNADGVLEPQLLSLDSNASAAWVAFHNAIEAELSSGGELCDVRDVASKMADNAVRLAAAFHVFENGLRGSVGVESFNGACRIAAWHLNESRRFCGELALPSDLANASRLDSWLIDCCRRERVSVVSVRRVLQYGPGGMRRQPLVEAAVRELEELHRVKLVSDGRRKEIHVNPVLLGRGAS